jgi:hypothetical protein
VKATGRAGQARLVTLQKIGRRHRASH